MDKKNKNKYNDMIEKLELLQNQKKNLEFRIKRLIENIDEFETNHLYDSIDKIIKENDDSDCM